MLAHVEEHPARIPYFEGLQLLLDSDFLIVPGSDDPQYAASKIFPYILARKPLLALFNEKSSVCDIVRRTASGEVLGFKPGVDSDSYCAEFYRLWTDNLCRLPFEPRTDWRAFEGYTAREMARKQSELFDEVLEQSKVGSPYSAAIRFNITRHGFAPWRLHRILIWKCFFVIKRRLGNRALPGLVLNSNGTSPYSTDIAIVF